MNEYTRLTMLGAVFGSAAAVQSEDAGGTCSTHVVIENMPGGGDVAQHFDDAFAAQ